MDDFTWSIIEGDCLEVLKECPDNYFDAVCTDPPAGIEFLPGSIQWDKFKNRERSRSWACGGKTGNDGFGGFAKTLRPAFCELTRKDRDAYIGFMVEVFSEVARVIKPGAHCFVWSLPRVGHWTAISLEEAGLTIRENVCHLFGQGMPKSKKLDGGFGSSLKPSHENWILARKPLDKGLSLTKNFEVWGTGGLNIEACRVERDVNDVPGWHMSGADGTKGYHGSSAFRIRAMDAEEIQERCGEKGRWPPDTLLSCLCEGDEHEIGCPVGELESEQKGVSRYFPCFVYRSKPSRAEKEAGLDELPERTLHRVNSGGLENEPRFSPVQVKNNHPTVKGIPLCRWLCRLITPPNGIILDPFAGSGSIGCSAMLENFRYVGIEQDPSYVEISRSRIEHWSKSRRD